MRKAILLTVSLWIEGEDEPVHNWAASSMRAVREIIAAGKHTHPELEVSIRKIEENTNYDDEPLSDHN